MKLLVGLIPFCAILCVSASDGDLSESMDHAKHTLHGMPRFSLELLLTKFAMMELKLQKIENDILQHQSKQDRIVAALQEQQSRQEKGQNEMLAVLRDLKHQVAVNLSEIHNRDQEKVNTALHKLDQHVGNVHNNTRRIMNALLQLHSLIQVLQNQCCLTPTENSVSTTTTTTPKPKQPPFSSCKDVPLKVSGTYQIRVKRYSEPFEVYCEQESFEGGWIVFQFRSDGSLDFYRGWNEFRDGFGDLNKEFWLGLEKVHQITSGRKHELIIELKDFEGMYKYARYGAFEIGSESDQYNLKEFGNYSGTAGDNMSHYRGKKFSTKDRDNDAYDSNYCAPLMEGAWWYWSCSDSNLNGRYMNAVDMKSMFWFYFKNNIQGLSYSRMMIRELE
ncbi:fibrinogen-like protein A [Anopheles aquasalis]|uniref:fibrinogen-like protein A n=1 Tax=Anopheles aquasalis TaxID=42839 RepID=UPI00215B6155|nr:fibrinogen-like protein A [Anopheles aquasalis]